MTLIITYNDKTNNRVVMYADDCEFDINTGETHSVKKISYDKEAEFAISHHGLAIWQEGDLDTYISSIKPILTETDPKLCMEKLKDHLNTNVELLKHSVFSADCGFHVCLRRENKLFLFHIFYNDEKKEFVWHRSDTDFLYNGFVNAVNLVFSGYETGGLARQVVSERREPLIGLLYQFSIDLAELFSIKGRSLIGNKIQVVDITKDDFQERETTLDYLRDHSKVVPLSDMGGITIFSSEQNHSADFQIKDDLESNLYRGTGMVIKESLSIPPTESKIIRIWGNDKIDLSDQVFDHKKRKRLLTSSDDGSLE